MANQYIYNLSDTWTDSGTAYDAIKINVTNTGSAASSKLLNLQVDSAMKFGIDASGAVNMAGALSGVVDLTMSGALTGATNITGSGTFTADRLTVTKTTANAPAISSTGYSLTGTNAQSLVDLAGTWNTSGTPTAIKLNITSDTSNAASLLLDLQTANTSRFRVRKDGLVAGVNSACWLSHGAGGYFAISSPTATTWASISSTSAVFPLAGSIGFGNLAAGVDAVADTMLFRDGAANTLAQRNAANAQTFNIYNTYSSSTSYERLSIIAQSAAAVQIVTNKGSAGGSARALELGTDGTTRLTISTTGGVETTGAVTANGGVTIPFGQRLAFSSVANMGSSLVGGYSIGFHIDSTNPIAQIQNTVSIFPSLQIGSGTTSSTHPVIVKDGNNTLALQNGTTAQIFNLYSTSSSSNTNYERLSLISQAAGAFRIYTQKAGTGAAQALELGTDGTTRFTITTTGLLKTSGNLEIDTTSSVYWNNRAGMSSPADGRIRLGNQAGTDFDRLQFGGTTSSFPALKRSSATLICRLADDSANAAFESASVRTDAPTGGTAATWKLGTVASVNPTSPNRTIEVEIGGVTYYLHAKTTND